jgi:hypothetical protein
MKLIRKKGWSLLTILYGGYGASLGIMLCGYIGEKISWSWGFG